MDVGASLMALVGKSRHAFHSDLRQQQALQCEAMSEEALRNILTAIVWGAVIADVCEGSKGSRRNSSIGLQQPGIKTLVGPSPSPVIIEKV